MRIFFDDKSYCVCQAQKRHYCKVVVRLVISTALVTVEMFLKVISSYEKKWNDCMYNGIMKITFKNIYIFLSRLYYTILEAIGCLISLIIHPSELRLSLGV